MLCSSNEQYTINAKQNFSIFSAHFPVQWWRVTFKYPAGYPGICIGQHILWEDTLTLFTAACTMTSDSSLFHRFWWRVTFKYPAGYPGICIGQHILWEDTLTLFIAACTMTSDSSLFHRFSLRFLNVDSVGPKSYARSTHVWVWASTFAKTSTISLLWKISAFFYPHFILSVKLHSVHNKIWSTKLIMYSLPMVNMLNTIHN